MFVFAIMNCEKQAKNNHKTELYNPVTFNSHKPDAISLNTGILIVWSFSDGNAALTCTLMVFV